MPNGCAARVCSNRYSAVHCDAVARCAHIAACGGCHEAAPAASRRRLHRSSSHCGRGGQPGFCTGSPELFQRMLVMRMPVSISTGFSSLSLRSSCTCRHVAITQHATFTRANLPRLLRGTHGASSTREMQPSTPSKRQTHTTAAQVASASHPRETHLDAPVLERERERWHRVGQRLGRVP